MTIAYKHHTNFATSLMGDTASKLMDEIEDETWMDRPCNCGLAFKKDGLCLFGGKCREAAVVYKVKCRCCDSFYIGKME